MALRVGGVGGGRGGGLCIFCSLLSSLIGVGLAARLASGAGGGKPGGGGGGV